MENDNFIKMLFTSDPIFNQPTSCNIKPFWTDHKCENTLQTIGEAYKPFGQQIYSIKTWFGFQIP